LIIILSLFLFSQEDEKWDVTSHKGNFKEVEFTVDNGTWLNLDVSPDGKWIAFNDLHNAYIAAMPSAGKALELSKDTKAFPVARITKDAGYNLHWSADSKTIYWMLGNEYFSNKLEDRFEFLNDGEKELPPLDSIGNGAEGDFKAVINSLEDARSHLRRTKAFGAFSVKSYNQPRRNQRQMVMEATRLGNMIVVPEGGSHFFHNMSMVLDGHTGVEHNIPVAPLYDDVLNVWAACKPITLQLLFVAYGAVTGEYY